MSELGWLLYVSTRTRELTVDDLERLLEAAVRRNERAGVTGLLLYSGRHFMQYLEGSAQALDETMTVIRRSPLHDHIVEARRGRTPTRLFPDWAMSFRTPNLVSISDPRAGDWMQSAPARPSEAMDYVRTAMRAFWRGAAISGAGAGDAQGATTDGEPGSR